MIGDVDGGEIGIKQRIAWREFKKGGEEHSGSGWRAGIWVSLSEWVYEVSLNHRLRWEFEEMETFWEYLFMRNVGNVFGYNLKFWFSHKCEHH